MLKFHGFVLLQSIGLLWLTCHCIQHSWFATHFLEVTEQGNPTLLHWNEFSINVNYEFVSEIVNNFKRKSFNRSWTKFPELTPSHVGKCTRQKTAHIFSMRFQFRRRIHLQYFWNCIHETIKHVPFQYVNSNIMLTDSACKFSFWNRFISSVILGDFPGVKSHHS